MQVEVVKEYGPFKQRRKGCETRHGMCKVTLLPLQRIITTDHTIGYRCRPMTWVLSPD